LISRPARIITTGGILALPVACAAFCLAIPLDLYVLDAVPGKALLALNSFADTIYCCFEDSKKFFVHPKVYLCDYPLQYSLEELNCSQDDALIKLGFNTKKKTLLVLGGSQGSLFLNNLIRHWIVENPLHAEQVQIIHQYGNDTTTDWHTWYDLNHTACHYVFDYTKNLSCMYSAADLIVARAGAGTIFEAKAFGKKTVLIPLKTFSTEHQVDNAIAIQKMFPDQFDFFFQEDIERDVKLLYNTISAHLQ